MKSVIGILFLTVFLIVPAQTEVVRYRDFGAVGDGKTNDQAAIAKAHDHANQNGLAVQAEDGATYLIGNVERPIRIQTSTDFGDARFLIDDRAFENPRKHVFEVASIHEPIRFTEVRSLLRSQQHIPARFPQSCLVTLEDDTVKRFIRRGKNQNAGKAQTDVLIVDPAGRIDPKAPLLWDFDRISKLVAYPIDAETLTLRGGKFTTIANASDSTTYFARGISIRRSNVVVEHLEHRITGEGDQGAPYQGFLTISHCANVLVRNCVFTGRKTYHKIGNAGQRVPMGSYGISIDGAVQVTLQNVTQTNDILDRNYWGIIGTNFCKNLTFDHCTLSRFDAHMGVTHATIRNSTLGYMGVRLTGHGDFLIENSIVHDRHFITLRPDYGSTWNGRIVIRDCRWKPPTLGGGGPCILSGDNDGQHDFGYPCHMPESLVIDGLHLEDAKADKGYRGPAIFDDFNPQRKSEKYQEKFPYQITRKVTYRNMTTESGKPLRLGDNTFLFREVEVQKQ